MGLGMIGAIGGVGEGLQTQGSYWAEEKKQARIEEMKIAAEGRAEKRGLEAEGRQEKSKLDAEGRANAEFNRREGSKKSTSRSQSDYEREQKFADDQRRQEAGLLNTGNQHKPRSPAEDRKIYNQELKDIREANLTRGADNKLPEPSWEEWRRDTGLLGERTGEKVASNKELNSENGNHSGKSETKKVSRKYTETSESTAKLLKERQVPDSTLPNMKRAISSGKMTADQAADALKKAGYPTDAINAMMADIELSGL